MIVMIQHCRLSPLGIDDPHENNDIHWLADRTPVNLASDLCSWCRRSEMENWPTVINPHLEPVLFYGGMHLD